MGRGGASEVVRNEKQRGKSMAGCGGASNGKQMTEKQQSAQSVGVNKLVVPKTSIKTASISFPGKLHNATVSL